MISHISPANQPWTRGDLTGNSTFIQIAGEIFVVSNTQVDNTFHIYRSVDDGKTFVTVQSYQFLHPNPQFEPVVFYDGEGIHIIGMQPNESDPERSDLVSFVFMVASLSLSNPATLIVGSRIRAAYDLTLLADTSFIITVAVVDSIVPRVDGSALLELHLAESFDAVISVNTILSSPPHSGEVVGGVSLTSSNGLASLYFSHHEKLVTSRKTLHTIKRTVRDDNATIWADTWSTPEVIYTYVGDMVDDKLTAITITSGEAPTTVLTHLYYTRVGNSLTSTLVIGAEVSGQWSFREITDHIAEPTLCVSDTGGWVVAYLVKNHITDVSGNLHVFDLTPEGIVLTERPGHFNRVSLAWVRGTKSPVSSASSWMVLGEAATADPLAFDPLFISELNSPPVGVLSPSTAQISRHEVLALDASGSYDNDFDILDFNWSIVGLSPADLLFVTLTPNGAKATVEVSKTIGPAEKVFSVSLSIQDLNTASAPINSPTIVSCATTLQAKPAPVVTWSESIVTGTRNENVTLVPVITDQINDLVYSWQQIRGTTIEVDGGLNGPTLRLRLVGAKVLGEDLIFSLSVSDGVNSPVVSSVIVRVPAVIMDELDVRRFSRVFWTDGAIRKTLAERNEAGVWDTVYPSYSSDFYRLREDRSSLGKTRQTMVSGSSVLVLGEVSQFYRKRLLPNGRHGIIEGWHTENDFTLVLDNLGTLYRYEVPGPDNCSDYPQRLIDLTDYVEASNIKRVTANGLYRNKRVIAIHTTVGLLLFQVAEDSFAVESVLKLAVADFTLYGADDVQFVRFDGVESLRKGEILIGTSNGTDFYETLFDLSVRSATGVWDRTTRINLKVNTGEILKARATDYTGVPPTPTLYVPTVTDGTYSLAWQQIRPDLISAYEVEGREFSQPAFQLISRIGSGAVLSAEVTPTVTPYITRVRALNPDGYSAYSNEGYLGSPLPPTLTAGVALSDFVLTWTQPIPAMAASYIIEGHPTGVSAFTQVGTTTAPSFNFTVLSGQSPYTMRVKTVGAFGTSTVSNEIALVRRNWLLGVTQDQPLIITGVGTNVITLSWVFTITRSGTYTADLFAHLTNYWPSINDGFVAAIDQTSGVTSLTYPNTSALVEVADTFTLNLTGTEAEWLTRLTSEGGSFPISFLVADVGGSGETMALTIVRHDL